MNIKKSGNIIRSVDNLQALYTVVIALALVKAIETLFSINNSNNLIFHYEYLLTTISLIITIIPIHHGASRYLDITYTVRRDVRSKYAGMLDFLFFFLEAILFFVLALVLTNNITFYIFIIGLLLLDVIWLSTVRLTNPDNFPKVIKWLKINLITILMLGIGIIIVHLKIFNDNIFVWIILSITIILRTVVDYAWNWEFYWPIE